MVMSHLCTLPLILGFHPLHVTYDALMLDSFLSEPTLIKAKNMSALCPILGAPSRFIKSNRTSL